MSANDNNLSEIVSPREPGKAAPQEEMDHQEANTPITPTHAAQVSLQEMALGDKEKHEKELELTSKLLDQVKGFFGFDNMQTHAKAQQTVTHSD